MRRILIISAVMLAWTSTAFAAELMVKIPVDEYKQTKKEIDSLKQQVSDLERRISGSAPAAPAASAAPAAMSSGPASDRQIRKINRDISEIYDTLDEVETASLLDRINLGAEVRVRMDNYRVKNYDNAMFGPRVAPSDDERNDGNWSSRFRINMSADVSKTVKFAGRLALQKNWADSVGDSWLANDTNRAHVSDGTTNIKIDRMYIDWTPKLFTPVTVTFGRLPTSEGPPNEFKEDRQRQSIYPSLIFDGEPDGLVVTFGLERYLNLKNSGLRYFFAMASQYDSAQMSMSHMDYVWDDLYQDNKVQALFFETELPGLRDSLLVLSYVPAQEILMMSPMSVDALENPVPGEVMDNLGDITLYGAHLQLSDLFRSGLDLFASFGVNKNKPNGHTINFGGENYGLFSGGGGSIPLGSEDTASLEETTGWAWSAGFRYELPVRFLNRPKIGFEYNRGNKYWFSYTPGSSEIFNKAATRGEVYDVYYIQPFNKNLSMRTGYTLIEYLSTGSGMPFGQPGEYLDFLGVTAEPEFHNFYVILESRF